MGHCEIMMTGTLDNQTIIAPDKTVWWVNGLSLSGMMMPVELTSYSYVRNDD